MNVWTKPADNKWNASSYRESAPQYNAASYQPVSFQPQVSSLQSYLQGLAEIIAASQLLGGLLGQFLGGGVQPAYGASVPQGQPGPLPVPTYGSSFPQGQPVYQPQRAYVPHQPGDSIPQGGPVPNYQPPAGSAHDAWAFARGLFNN